MSNWSSKKKSAPRYCVAKGIACSFCEWLYVHRARLFSIRSQISRHTSALVSASAHIFCTITFQCAFVPHCIPRANFDGFIVSNNGNLAYSIITGSKSSKSLLDLTNDGFCKQRILRGIEFAKIFSPPYNDVQTFIAISFLKLWTIRIPRWIN